MTDEGRQGADAPSWTGDALRRGRDPGEGDPSRPGPEADEHLSEGEPGAEAASDEPGVEPEPVVEREGAFEPEPALESDGKNEPGDTLAADATPGAESPAEPAPGVIPTVDAEPAANPDPDAEPDPDGGRGEPDARREPPEGPDEDASPAEAPTAPSAATRAEAARARRAPLPDTSRSALAIARLHLRMGTVALARAELEASAGAGSLDDESLVDLAEARWRTGDLAGAGDAAAAAIERGVEDTRAYVIAAESIHASGRPAEARRLATRALALAGGPLEPLFAGMPRSLIWPVDGPDDASPAAARQRTDDNDRSQAPAAAAEAFAGGRAALARGDIPLAALRLGVAIRLDPKFAQGVLTAIGERAADPMLALVAGDALRLLGREDEALEAWQRARGKPALPPEHDPVPLWPEDDAAG